MQYKKGVHPESGYYRLGMDAFVLTFYILYASAKGMSIPKEAKPPGKIFSKLKAVRTGQLDIGEGAHTPESVMSLAEELTMLRKRVKDQDKEIRRLKEENEFLEEVSAFFAASRRKSLRPKE